MTSKQPTPLRGQVSELLRHLRGQVPLSTVAQHLGMVRQSFMKIEEGKVSYERLDALGETYGVRFEIRAVDATTGHPVDGAAPALRGLVTTTAPPS